MSRGCSADALEGETAVGCNGDQGDETARVTSGENLTARNQVIDDRIGFQPRMDIHFSLSGCLRLQREFF
jgi:hypothetical protein